MITAPARSRCAPGCATPARHSLCRRHTLPAANSAKIAKKTPVTSSQSTPESRANGSHAASRNRLSPRRTPRAWVAPFATPCAATRAALLTAGRSGGIPASAGFGIGVAVSCAAARAPLPVAFLLVVALVLRVALCAATGFALLLDGFSAVAASTALATVFTACRAPIPSARPKRTASISRSLAFRRAWTKARLMSRLQISVRIPAPALRAIATMRAWCPSKSAVAGFKPCTSARPQQVRGDRQKGCKEEL
jgi:hypothetical protein